MKKGKIFGNLTMAAALVLLAVILIFNVGAVGQLHGSYAALAEQELSGEEIVTVFFTDKLLVQLGYSANDAAITMADFLQNALMNIDMRIVTAGIVYTAVVTALLSCYPAYRYGSNKRKHIAAVIICGVITFLIYSAAIFGTMLVKKVPVYLPAGKSLITVFVGLLAVLGGNCAFAAWLRSAKRRSLISILAIVVVLATYLFGSLCEMGIFSEPTLESFEYFYAENEQILEDDFGGAAYYDESKNVMVLNGKEYSPKIYPNPEHLTGVKRAGTIVLEALNPYSPISLPLIMHAAELDIPLIALILYSGKSMLWILLPALLRKKSAASEE